MMCQALNCLPQAGGMLDQDCLIVLGMKIVLEAQAKKDKRDAEKAQKKK